MRDKLNDDRSHKSVKYRC